MAHGSADAVGAGVATTNDDDVPARGINEAAILVAIEDRLGVRGEELHREVNTLQLATRNREIARLRGAGANDGGVELLEQRFSGQIGADTGIAHELHSFVLQQLDAAQDNFLLVELHVGDAIHEQSAGAVITLVNGDGVAGLVQLSGGAQSRGARADDGDLLAGAPGRRFALQPSLPPNPGR